MKTQIKKFAVVIVTAIVRLIAMLLSPPAIAAASFLCGSGLVIAGIYILFDTGWALLAGAVPFLLLAAVLIRGMTRG